MHSRNILVSANSSGYALEAYAYKCSHVVCMVRGLSEVVVAKGATRESIVYKK